MNISPLTIFTLHIKVLTKKTLVPKLCWLFSQLLWSMEQGKVTTMVALDRSTAFDTIEHKTLCAVFEKDFGITNTSLNWIESYLKN